MAQSLHDAAVAYARRGWAVFALKPRSKEPATLHGVKDATTDVEAIDEWWTEHPRCNIGIAMGAPSGGLIAIDVDVDEDAGKDGMATLRAWERDRGELPETASAITGRGGVHMLYRMEGVRNSVGGDCAVDVRGEGGYIVAPPSVHPNGQRYEWEYDPVDYGVADADGNVRAFIESVRPKRDESAPKLHVPKRIGEGKRNDTLFRMACSMQSQEWPDEAIRAAIEAANRMQCEPPLPDDDVAKLLDSALSLPKGNSDACQKAVDDAKEAKAEKKAAKEHSFDHAAFADELMDERHICYIDGALCAWNGTRYLVGNDAVEVAMIQKRKGIKQQQRREAMAYITLMAEEKEPADDRYIAFSNCVLDVMTGETMPNTPDMGITNVIPHRWNPDAECEIVDNTLDKMACGDFDTFETLIEVIGLCIYRGTEFGKMPVLVGVGSNGKSTYINMVRRLLGRENYSASDLATIGERFQSVALIGKLANLGDDISNEFVSGSKASVVKKVVTGDEVSAEYKGGKTFSFWPRCTLVFSANEMPRLGDASYGMMRRLLPVPFNAQFTQEDDDYDPYIDRKLMTEEAMERLAVLAVIGIGNCIHRGGMLESVSSREIAHAIQLENNSAMSWLEEAGIDELAGCEVASLYKRYTDWCDESRLKPVSRVKFVRYVGKERHVRSKTARNPVTGALGKYFVKE